MAAFAVKLAGTGENLLMGLLAAHDARINAAKEENAAVNQAVVALDHDLSTIFTAANNGDISAKVAAQAILSVHNWYWQFIKPLQQGSTKGPQQTFPTPGAPNSNATGGIYYEAIDGTDCHCGTDKNCTAGCCVGCAAIDPTLSNAYVGFLSGKSFSMTTAVIVANKYGVTQRDPYSLTYTIPATQNPEAEVTLNAKTGIVTVGAQATSNDVIIAQGVVSTQSNPDAGGDQIQHTPSGTDNPSTTAQGPSSILSSIPGGNTTLYIVGALILFLLLMPAKQQQPVIIQQG